MNQFFHNLTFPPKVVEGFHYDGRNRFFTAVIPETSDAHFFAGEHKYNLRNVTIHTPAEHRIGNKVYDMEMQLNYEDTFSNLASVSVMFVAVEDLAGSFYQQFARSDFWRDFSGAHFQQGSYLNLAPYLPKNDKELHFYAYQGSQTHPPCYEGVHWFVLSRPHQVLKADVEKLLQLFGSNARPIQAGLGRGVGFY